MLKLSFLTLIVLIISQTSGLKVTREQQEMLQGIEKDDVLNEQPYLGGYNADLAKLIIVDFIPDSNLYKKDLREKQYKAKNQNQRDQDGLQFIFPSHYKPSQEEARRTFKEMVKDYQEVLMTGGIHTNMFRSSQYQITIAVNDINALESVAEFWLGQEEAMSVTYDRKTRYKEGWRPKKMQKNQQQNYNRKQDKKDQLGNVDLTAEKQEL